MLFEKMNKSSRILSTLLYITGDIIYVILSASFYQKFMESSGQALPAIQDRWVFALAAYAAMSLGWYSFVLPTAYGWKLQKWCAWRIGLILGVAYALTVIGTFNFTLAALLPYWTGWVIWRDMLWASSWNTVMIWVYFFVFPYQSKDPL